MNDKDFGEFIIKGIESEKHLYEHFIDSLELLARFVKGELPSQEEYIKQLLEEHDI